MVEAIATVDPGGVIQVLVWNGSLDQTKLDGDPLLGRKIALEIAGASALRYRREHLRVDLEHSNLSRRWIALGSPDWPGPAGWERLRAGDQLEPLEPAETLEPSRGDLSLGFDLPMPGVSLIRLTPV
jgi:xylan 1,4-beta-xylosidase